MKYFLDTNICIYFLNGTFASIAKNLAGVKPMDVKIPSLVRAELLYGARKSAKRDANLKRIKQFLEPFEVVNFGVEAAEIYAEIRVGLEKAGKPIGPNDLVIAATVLAGGGVLVTRNKKEFGRVKGLKIEDWVE